jgi:DNA polymerase
MSVLEQQYRLARRSGPSHGSARAPLFPTVMWVGISDKPFLAPLAPETPTGSVISRIERTLRGLSFHRTNLVRRAPLDAHGRLRYPTREEMARGADALVLELQHVQPRIVVTLGAAVSKTVVEDVAQSGRFTGLGGSFRYSPRRGNNFLVLPVHHPSFILIYRRRKLRQYIRAICAWLGEIATCSFQGAPG